ncbi:MAG: DUF2127 domain-containing protein [Actinomycetota bacterium]
MRSLVSHKRREQWDRETLVCGARGHVTPAARVARLRPEDAGLGVELDDGRRMVRCTRCDAWLETSPPVDPVRETLPALEDLRLPRRGRELRDAIVLRIIAIDRAFHSIIFGTLAGVVLFVYVRLGVVHREAERLLKSISNAAQTTGADQSRGFVFTQLNNIAHLHGHTLAIVGATALAYFVIEGVEAVGLWRERRWAEYLTAVATAGFLPFEVHELITRVTVFRISALVINIAILIYLVWAKHLFGVAGGRAEERREEEIDRMALFGPPASTA